MRTLFDEETRNFRLPDDLHPRGCAMLAHAVLLHALTSNRIAGRSWGFSSLALQKRAMMLRRFVDSPIVEHFADVFGYDPIRIRRRILQRSRLLLRIARRGEDNPSLAPRNR